MKAIRCLEKWPRVCVEMRTSVVAHVAYMSHGPVSVQQAHVGFAEKPLIGSQDSLPVRLTRVVGYPGFAADRAAHSLESMQIAQRVGAGAGRCVPT